MKIFIPTILFLGLSFSVLAQSKINVKEGNSSLSVGNVNTLSVNVYGMKPDDVEKAWKKQMKDINGDVKVKKEVFADDCLIKDMSDNTFDVYALVKEVEGGAELIAAFDLGGAYMNSTDHKAFFTRLSKMMYEFAVEQTKEAISGDIKIAEDELKDTEKAKEDLEKNIKKMEDEIEDYKQKIEDNKKNIEQSKKDIETKKGEMTAKKEVIEALANKKAAVK